MFLSWQRLPVPRTRRHVREKAEVLCSSNRRFAHESQRLAGVVTFNQGDLTRILFNCIGNLVQEFLAFLARQIPPAFECGFRCFTGRIDVGSVSRHNFSGDAVIDRRQIFKGLPRTTGITLTVDKVWQGISAESP